MINETITSKIGISCNKYVLDNGLEVYIVPRSEYSSAYALFGTKYGSIDTKFSSDGVNFTEVPEGIAHFLEHKLFESEDGDAFTRYAKTGAYANAYTSFDRTCYIFSCASSFDDNLDILLDFVQSPYFTAETVKKEQGIIGQEIRMYEDSPGWRVMFNMLEAMYENHPVRIDIAGTVDSIAKIDDKLLYECYNTFYHPSNMFICIAGNVDSELVIEKIKSSIKKSDKKQIIRGRFVEKPQVKMPYTEQVLQVAQPLFCYGFKLDNDKPLLSVKEKIAYQLACEYIAGDNSDMFERLINEGLVNDEFETEVFAGYGYASVLFSGESTNPTKVKEIIDSEIKKTIDNGFDSELFEAVRRGMYGDAIKKFNSVEAIASSLCECAVNGEKVFEDIEVLRELTETEVYGCLKNLSCENSVLSVIKNKE